MPIFNGVDYTDADITWFCETSIEQCMSLADHQRYHQIGRDISCQFALNPVESDTSTFSQLTQESGQQTQVRHNAGGVDFDISPSASPYIGDFTSKANGIAALNSSTLQNGQSACFTVSGGCSSTYINTGCGYIELQPKSDVYVDSADFSAATSVTDIKTTATGSINSGPIASYTITNPDPCRSISIVVDVGFQNLLRGFSGQAFSMQYFLSIDFGSGVLSFFFSGVDDTLATSQPSSLGNQKGSTTNLRAPTQITLGPSQSLTIRAQISHLIESGNRDGAITNVGDVSLLQSVVMNFLGRTI